MCDGLECRVFRRARCEHAFDPCVSRLTLMDVTLEAHTAITTRPRQSNELFEYQGTFFLQNIRGGKDWHQQCVGPGVAGSGGTSVTGILIVSTIRLLTSL